MVDKRGFIRIIEATVAILVILGVLLLISQQRGGAPQEDFTKIIPPILEEMAQDFSYRDGVLRGDEYIEDEIEDFVKVRLKSSALDVSVKICELGETCLSGNENLEEVYSAERVISASVNVPNASPKRVKVFLWRKDS